MAALPAVIVQTCHCPDLSLRGAQRRGNPLKDVSVPGDCFVALLLRMTVPAFPVRLKTLQSRFRSLSLTAAVRGAKVRADLALVRTVPQSDAKKRWNSVLLVPIASACCTCVPGLLPHLPAATLAVCF